MKRAPCTITVERFRKRSRQKATDIDSIEKILWLIIVALAVILLTAQADMSLFPCEEKAGSALTVFLEED